MGVGRYLDQNAGRTENLDLSQHRLGMGRFRETIACVMKPAIQPRSVDSAWRTAGRLDCS